MKTRSFHFTASLLCAVVIAMVAPLRADDVHVRIKIPNPIPKIVKGIKRVSERVGDIVVRTAERIEGEEEVEEARRPVPPPYPPPGRVTLSIEPTRPPLVPPQGEANRNSLVPYESVRGVPRPNPPPTAKLNPSGGRSASPTVYAPAEVPRSADGTALKSGEAGYRPMPPSVAVSPSATVTTPASGEAAVAATAEKPTPPPEHPYGKPVPGRPGLVYPPGMKEIPENMIDVRGITPGTKVRDPVTKMVFRVP